MAFVQTNRTHLLHCLHSLPSSSHLPKHHHIRSPNNFTLCSNSLFPGKIRVYRSSYGIRDGVYSICCICKATSEIGNVSVQDEETQRPPFDINLAVILAGFSFEAYTTPPENIGKLEVDAAGCKTIYLSESFLREVYDGQLFVKLKKGFKFPAMDPWGTSDPYVVMQLDGQVVKSKVKWGTKEPTWNEDFTLNIKQPPTKNLQVAAWDANLVTPHKRMGNAGLSLEGLCDGVSHEWLVELEGMGGGGKVQLEGLYPGHICQPKVDAHDTGELEESTDIITIIQSWSCYNTVKYKSFDELDEEKKWWRVPFVSEFLRQNGFESALKMFTGSETVQARQFVQYAFGQLKIFNDANLSMGQILNRGKYDAQGTEKANNTIAVSGMSAETEEGSQDLSLNDANKNEDSNFHEFLADNSDTDNRNAPTMAVQGAVAVPSNKHFWKNFADVINQKVVQKLGVPVPEKLKWDGFDLLNRIGLQSREIAEAGYVESGLATPKTQDVVDVDDASTGSLTINKIQSSLPDIKKATEEVLRQTDSILGALMVLTAFVSQTKKDKSQGEKDEIIEDAAANVEANVSEYLKRDSMDELVLDEKKAEEMKALFSTAETAMEAWAMLAISLGHPSFIKSEFEKLCFLDNESTDTQVAIWRDSVRRRLVIAFRGTEQVRWKDLRTDLMLAPAGLNPERIGGDFKQEVQVHSGFLSAYDSVRMRIISLMKLSIGYIDNCVQPEQKWHVYVTGHSLGGALATLLALELSSSQLAKSGAISVTMYNFGSPRVGNKRFAEVYNEKVKDTWRVVNHRDIIPTVPRLMGYCHVAQPVYLAAGDLSNALENIGLLGDGYQGDVIGESTPDVLVSEFMKGEKELIEKILQTEINIFRSIRDGSALMQHMEDFYYVSLLENVRSNYQTIASSQANEE